MKQLVAYYEYDLFIEKEKAYDLMFIFDESSNSFRMRFDNSIAYSLDMVFYDDRFILFEFDEEKDELSRYDSKTILLDKMSQNSCLREFELSYTEDKQKKLRSIMEEMNRYYQLTNNKDNLEKLSIAISAILDLEKSDE